MHKEQWQMELSVEKTAGEGCGGEGVCVGGGGGGGRWALISFARMKKRVREKSRECHNSKLRLSRNHEEEETDKTKQIKQMYENH